MADAAAQLAQAGIDEAELDAALLLGHVVSASRTLVRLFGERPLDAAQLAALADLVARRASREPLPYVLGYQEFMGLRLRCDRRALIPRWDTEALAEAATTALSGYVSPRVADIGTGTGALAISIAHALPTAEVWAVDASPDALALATENAALLGLSDRVHPLLGHLATPLPAEVSFDGIVANLPYIPRGELPGLQPEVRDWEPGAALDGGDDGLDLLRELAATAYVHLAPGGWLLLEHADDQSDAVRALLGEYGYQAIRLVHDWAGRCRGVWGEWHP